MKEPDSLLNTQFCKKLFKEIRKKKKIIIIIICNWWLYCILEVNCYNLVEKTLSSEGNYHLKESDINVSKSHLFFYSQKIPQHFQPLIYHPRRLTCKALTTRSKLLN